MSPTTIRRLDASLGVALCALLSVHRRIFGRAAVTRGAPRKILFIKFIEQGATVLAYDAIHRAVERVGRENVFFWVFEENRPILDIMDVIAPENVFAVRGGSFLGFVLDIMTTLRRIRQLGIDCTIDMEFLARAPAIAAYLTGAQHRVGLHRFTEAAPYRGDLMTHRVLYNPFLHTTRSYRLLVDALDADPNDLPLVKSAGESSVEAAPHFVPRPAERQRIQALLDEIAGRRVGRPLVLLNPNSGDMLPLRRWPIERFVDLAQRILADHAETNVVITGAASERTVVEAICAAIDSPRVINLAGRTSLRDVVVLYTLADVLVTNDSGPGHFASLTSIDNIVIFGPGAPSQFGPIGGRSHVLWAGLACSPCVNVCNQRYSICGNNVCMQAITVDMVYARVRACLAARGSRRTELSSVRTG